MYKRFFAVALTIIAALPFAANAQENKDQLSGSFETNSAWYVKDKATGVDPRDRFATNNYLKIDYNRGKFSAGAQFEYYNPALVGYDSRLTGGGLTNVFVGWTDGRFGVTAGTFYEQFGSGLILRSYEDRALGFNNAIAGARITYNFGDVFAVKALAGRPRFYMGYADSYIRGADASFDISSLFGGMGGNYLALEGSYVNRHLPNRENTTDPADLNSWSGRLVFDAGFGLSLRAEAVGKSYDVYSVYNLVTETMDIKNLKGNAQLVELGYNNGGLGILLSARRLENMNMKMVDNDFTDGNIMNYLPSLTRQYTYSLTNLRPYQVQDMGELGGQLDVYYNFRRGTAMGGKYGTKLHVNGSIFFPLDYFDADSDKYISYWDASIDVEKQWSSKWKTTFLISAQYYEPFHGVSDEGFLMNAYVADVLYKFNRKHSLRLELQYLYAPDDTGTENWEKDWWAASLEYSFAPSWSVFVSDMYNYGNTPKKGSKDERVHYLSGGFSYSHSRTRVALSFGRYREGLVCSGGVCRMIPAYTGASLAFTTSF